MLQCHLHHCIDHLAAIILIGEFRILSFLPKPVYAKLFGPINVMNTTTTFIMLQ